MHEFITALRNADLLRYEGLETCHDNLARRGQDCEGSTAPPSTSHGRAIQEWGILVRLLISLVFSMMTNN